MAARTLSELSGPSGLPLAGNLFQLDLQRLHQQLNHWADEFGGNYIFKIGPKPVLVTSEPEAIQSALRQRPNLFRRLSSIEPVFNEMGINGVFSAEGDDWKRQRRLTAHALDANHLRQFFPTLIKVTERLRQRWKRAATAQSDVDVQQDLMRYTVDITTNLVFGYDMNTLEKEGDIIQEHLEKIFPAINRRVNAPFAYWRYFKLPTDRELEKSLAAVRETIQGFVNDARARLAKNPDLAAHPTNLMEAMLSARDEGNAAFSDEEIQGNAITMLLGGEDTTANTLAWLQLFMIEHPAAQASMQAEALEVVGPSGMPQTVADAERLRYIEAAVNETMRLKPVAPLLFLETIEDTELAGVAVPKQTAVFLNLMRPGQQDSHFGAAKEFRPERWLQPQAQTGCPHDPKAVYAFGGGARACPGRHLAMLEMKMVMSMFSSTFQVERAPNPVPVEEVFSFSMMPKNLNVRFKVCRPTTATPSPSFPGSNH
jgi:cytochrome P450